MSFMSPNYRNYKKSASNAFMPTGVYRAVIHYINWQTYTNYDDDGLVDIKIPQLTGDFIYKNVPCIGFNNTGSYNVGDLVYVASIDGRSDDFVVIGSQRGPLTQRPIVEQQAVFSWPGTPLSTEESGSFVFTARDDSGTYPNAPSFNRYYLLTGLRATMSNFGSSNTTVWMQVNHVDVQGWVIPYWTDNMYQFTFPRNTPMFNGATNVSRFLDAENDVVSFRVEEAGTDAADLVICLRYRAASPYDNGGWSD